MRQLIALINDNDLRHLLIEYDKDCNPVHLVPVLEQIMSEYEQLTGTKSYNNHFSKVDYSTYKLQLLNGIHFCIEALMLGCVQDAEDVIEAMNIRYNGKRIDVSDTRKALGFLDSLSKKMQNQITISQENEKKKDDNVKKVTWESKRVYVHVALSILPEYNCSVAQYIAYEQQIKQMEIARKEAAKHGN